jgi:poly(3-hydroxyalkanoate) synthetase
MYCWYTRNTYLENNIKDPGKTTQCGVQVDFSKIDVPLYLLASREDHIVPWKTAFRSKDLVGGEARFVLAAGTSPLSSILRPATSAATSLTTTLSPIRRAGSTPPKRNPEAGGRTGLRG